MRRFFAVGLAVLFAVLPAACERPAPATNDTSVARGADTGASTERYTRDSTGRVTAVDAELKVVCANGGVLVQLRPWNIEVNSGAAIRWSVTQAGSTDSITIRQKASDSGGWVLTAAPPYGRKGPGTIDGGTAIPVTGTDQSAYEIVFECSDGSRTYKGIIDPDIIVTM